MPAVEVSMSERRMPVVLFPRRQTSDQQAAVAFEQDASAGVIRQGASTGYLLRNSATKFAVGYVNSEGKLKVFEADMYSVDCVSKRKQSPRDQSGEDEAEEAQTFYESRQQLIDSYAPAKKQRQVRQAQNAQVKDERIEGKTGAIDGLKQDLKTKEDESGVAGQETGMLAMMREVLPEFDLSAMEPGKIYNFSSVFSDALIATLSLEEHSPVDAVLKWLKDDCPVLGGSQADNLKYGGEDVCSGILKLRVFNRLGNIFIQSKHMKTKTFARLFVICAGMFLFFKTRKQKLNKTAESCLLSEQLFNTFTNVYGRGRIANDMADKLLCHLCLFVLKLTPDCAFPFGLLVEDLQADLAHKDLQPVLEFVGCSVKNGTALNATLNAPLKVPQLFGNKRRRN